MKPVWFCEGGGCQKTTPAIALEKLWEAVGWGCVHMHDREDYPYVSIMCGECLAKEGVTYDDETGRFEK